MECLRYFSTGQNLHPDSFKSMQSTPPEQKHTITPSLETDNQMYPWYTALQRSTVKHHAVALATANSFQLGLLVIPWTDFFFSHLLFLSFWKSNYIMALIRKTNCGVLFLFFSSEKRRFHMCTSATKKGHLRPDWADCITGKVFRSIRELSRLNDLHFCVTFAWIVLGVCCI